MAAKKYRPEPAPGARGQAKREAGGELERRSGAAEACRGRAAAKSDATDAFLPRGAGEKAPPANTLNQLQKTF